LKSGNTVECEVVAQIEIRFKNQQTTCGAMVLTSITEPLLGAILLADMDVIIHRQIEINSKVSFPNSKINQGWCFYLLASV
jgi:hypothetical protein